MNARAEHAAVLLKNGKVLVSGGCVLDEKLGDVVAIASAEIYDPVTGRWAPTGSMNYPRYDHQMVILSDGRVLVAGGVPRGVSTEAIPECEIYDPETGIWSRTGSMSVHRRTQFTLSPLPDSRALAVGGAISWTLKATETAEIFDSKSGRWSFTGPLPTTRSGHNATVLQDGAVLIVGGWEHPHDHDSGVFLDTALIYKPSQTSWVIGSSAAGMKTQDSSALLLKDGRVLVAGGSDAIGVRNDSVIFTVQDSADFSSMVTYPNPVNLSRDPEVFINNLPEHATLKLYDDGGGLVQELKDDNGNGDIIWNGKNMSGQIVGPGVYYGVLRSDTASANLKITVQK